MDYATAIQVIDTFLHSRLEPTGTSGFEGLVAVLVQEATDQEFRLSSAGRQSGAVPGGSANQYTELVHASECVVTSTAP